MQQIVGILKYRVICIMLLACVADSAFAQPGAGILNKFENYSSNSLQEKLFVHTDRSAYFTGELLWFKIYAVDGMYNKPLSLSKVAYVEVLDDKQIPVMQAKIAMVNGSGNGSIFIPVTVNNGNYTLRAYTSWMKNFSPDFYFEKGITIINPQMVPEANTAKNNNNYDIQFFPEGGNLVSGIQSKIAFKAIDRDGSGVDFKGAIVDQKNDTIVRFAPLKFGMGHFLMMPSAGNAYRAVINIANTKPIVKELPAVATGFVMQLNDNGSNQLDVSVISNSNPADAVYLFIHTRQVVKVVKEAQLNSGVAHFAVDKNLLDDGISHITLFNSARQPVCERLYFKRPAAKLLIDASTDQQQYGTRKKVNVAIAAKNQSGKPVSADLSMSVYRLDGIQNAGQGDILSYLWLSSDLVGKVESPEYYFTDNSAEASEAADNLMLTQGWRRFDWSAILNNKAPAFSFLPETYGHIVAGKIVNAATNAPAKGIIAYLGAPGKRVQFYAAKSDSAGELLFNTKDLNAGEIVVQPNPLLDSTYRIDISNPFSEQFSQARLPAFTVSPNMQQAFEARNVDMQVQNIYAGDRTKQFVDPIVDSSGFYKKPTNSYLLDNYTRFTTMEEVLREYIREVSVVRRKDKFHLRIQGETSFLEDPMILVDGVPVFDADKLIAIDPLAIRKLEVVIDRYYYGPAKMEGIVSLTSYKGNLAGMEIDPHAVVVDYEGLQMQRVFYSPVYETESQVKSRLPDYRNLLYWSPSVSANDKNAVSFYTSDQDGDYIGLVQGITANGDAGSYYFRFAVKK